jgi:uncharacterized protein
MFIHTADKTLQDDLPPTPPIPTQVVSNGEYIPMPKSKEQRQIDALLAEFADRFGRKRGLTRREFFKTASGMAAAMLAINKVFTDRFFDVQEVEAADEAAAMEARKSDEFVIDVQTHYIDDPKKLWNTTDPVLRLVVDTLGGWREKSVKNSNWLDLNKTTYFKEIFVDSETSMAILSGFPSYPPEENILIPVDHMAAARDEINEKAGSRRMLSHGLISPNMPSWREEATRQVQKLGPIQAWKLYTADGQGGKRGWWLDDEQVAYPLYKHSLELGVKNLCIHKGLAVTVLNEEYCRAKDVEKAVLDWPQLNFIIYHSAFPRVEDITDIKWMKPQIKNLYGELGSTFALTVVGAPELAAHTLGKLLTHLGPDYVIWGTDSLWWGSPQWQIEALRRFRIPDRLIEGYGYTQITNEMKAKILGLNAARVLGIDVDKARREIGSDKIAQAKAGKGPTFTV